jgi:hypothetical protein
LIFFSGTNIKKRYLFRPILCLLKYSIASFFSNWFICELKQHLNLFTFSNSLPNYHHSQTSQDLSTDVKTRTAAAARDREVIEANEMVAIVAIETETTVKRPDAESITPKGKYKNLSDFYSIFVANINRFLLLFRSRSRS